MHLKGSCDCGRVHYTCTAPGPVPFMRCYCEHCRKTGSGGYMINLGADASSLKVEGQEHIKIHRAMVESNGKTRPSQHERHFCGECGSHLFARNDRWPDLLHPVASSVDTPLPSPSSTTHIFLRSKPDWLEAQVRPGDREFEGYPDESIEAWHRRHGCWQGEP